MDHFWTSDIPTGAHQLPLPWHFNNSGMIRTLEMTSIDGSSKVYRQACCTRLQPVVSSTSMSRALYALLFLSCAYLQGDDSANEVGQADKSYRRAMDARDVVVLERLVTDDFLFIRRTGDIWDKKAFLENLKTGKLASKVQEEDLKTRIYGDTAILTHKDSLQTADGSTIEMIATRVFVKQRDSWKLASVQDTTLPAR